MRILLVEDYGPLRLSVAERLREAGYIVDHTADGREGLWFAKENHYSLAILDLMLPGVHGLDILREIRQSKKETAVLITTAKDGINDRVQGLDAGADDYLVKPFALEELMARVRALVRRNHGAKDAVLRIGDLKVDTKRRSASRAGEEVELTSKEFGLLELLALRTGEVVRRSDVWEQLYDFNQDIESNVVDVYVAHLRKKLEKPGLKKLIHTRRGEGYILEERD
ncbi:MAG: response regulator transcription factor [Verrucomicrobia bacterium]|nr:response regulator transcription factor [Verrucomicrobiota bacterium]